MGKYFIIAVLLAFLGLSAWLATPGWNLHGEDVPMSGHGYIAMALGIIFSLVVGIGLMSLIFYSHSKGFDEPAQRRRTDE
jgi:hypothetical protein